MKWYIYAAIAFAVYVYAKQGSSSSTTDSSSGTIGGGGWTPQPTGIPPNAPYSTGPIGPQNDWDPLQITNPMGLMPDSTIDP